MKESDIRPDDLSAETQRLYKQDQARILAKKDQFVDVDCPVCLGNTRVLAWKRDQFEYQQCISCHSIYVSPRPTHELLVEHYKTSTSEKFWAENIYPASEKYRVENLIKPRVAKLLDFVQRFSVTPNTLMDIGAGFGTFCREVANTKGFADVIGVEPNPNPTQGRGAEGVKFINGTVEDVASSSADVVTCFELIEHVFSPRDLVSHVYRMLTPGGLFVVTTPNMAGFDLATLRDVSANTTAPDHINYFTTQSLIQLLTEFNFDVVETVTPGKLDAELVRKKVLSGEFSLDGQAFLQTVLIDRWDELGDKFQQFLVDNQLSSHLWVVAIKR